jgi:hypothetical protein
MEVLHSTRLNDPKLVKDTTVSFLIFNYRHSGEFLFFCGVPLPCVRGGAVACWRSHRRYATTKREYTAVAIPGDTPARIYIDACCCRHISVELAMPDPPYLPACTHTARSASHTGHSHARQQIGPIGHHQNKPSHRDQPVQTAWGTQRQSRLA